MISICTIIKDEHEYLKEWIDYHIGLGFTHFLLCEDIGSLSHKEITDAYDCAVELIQYNEEMDKYQPPSYHRQQALFEWFLATHKSGWCAFIDVDEFIVLENHCNIKEFLADYSECKGVTLSWRMIGASGHITRPKGGVVKNYGEITENLPCDNGYTYKSIVNLAKAEGFDNIHCINGAVNINGNSPSELVYETAWINHYYTKSWAEYVDKILTRGDVVAAHRGIGDFFSANPSMLPRADKMYRLLEGNETDIPKVIWCCWLSDEPMQNEYKECFATWQSVLKDYDIRLLTRENFDISSVPFIESACKHGEYIFASDYLRAYLLYNYGGIFLDLDVVVYRTFDELLKLPYFFSKELEDYGTIDAACIGSRKGNIALGQVLRYYNDVGILGSGFNKNLQYSSSLFYTMFKRHYIGVNVIDSPRFEWKPSQLNIFSKSFFSPLVMRERKEYREFHTYCCHKFVTKIKRLPKK